MSIAGLDRARLRADLVSYAGNLIGFIRSSNPAWTIDDVVGGKTITPLAGRQKIRLMATGAVHAVERVGVFTPKGVAVPALGPGEIGFITAGIKTVADCRVGDTITEDRRPAAAPLPGFKPVQPVVFCGLFPTDAADYERLRDSLAKLRLNDASFEYEPETSVALGFGFRCGFLGLLHLEIIQERLARELTSTCWRPRPRWSTGCI